MSEKTSRVIGKHRAVSSALLLVPFTLISSLAIGNSALNAGAQPRKNTMVFAVAGEADDYHMDAVVVVDGKQLRLPYTDEDKDKQKKFGDEYFAEGRIYRLTFGGGDAGTSCQGLRATGTGQCRDARRGSTREGGFCAPVAVALAAVVPRHLP